mmetsp:Transcript_17675/g.26776  ORF Transcript_17675/g.26776 Transcript_17675/m.26776 type:complete len:231 (-) Transcript_17675:60-752(-)
MKAFVTRNTIFRRQNFSRKNGKVFLPFNPDQICYMFPLHNQNDEQDKCVGGIHTIRTYHSSSQAMIRSTSHVERSFVAFSLGLGALAVGAHAGASAVSAYNDWKASRPSVEEESSGTNENDESKAENDTEKMKEETQKKTENKKEGPRENIFAKWFDVGGKYYEGGFEDIMTRREAALILGVRESSSSKRIKDAHRKLLILNHPDTGGSTCIAGKINEAKDLLLKGRSNK